MGLFARMGRAIARTFARLAEPFTPEESRAEPDWEPREAPGYDYDPEDRGSYSQLPPGWVLAGLYHEGQKTQRIHATDDTEVTDNEIHNADALIVWYEDAGADGYRWIHGATGWRSIADQIEHTIIIVSPQGKGN